MLTSESTLDEFRSFFTRNLRELQMKVFDVLNNRYRRTFKEYQKKGKAFPTFYGVLKVGEVTLYGGAKGLYNYHNGVMYKSLLCFAIMKDLRKQTKIMVVNAEPAIIIYETHAISRYKERIGLPEDMDFVEVCKHMVDVGCCGSPRMYMHMQEVHGTKEESRKVDFMCTNGTFLGHIAGETGMMHADTFLSSTEMREDQLYMDASKNPHLKEWREKRQLLKEDKLTVDDLKDTILDCVPAKIENNQAKALSSEEMEAQASEYDKKVQEHPNFLQEQVEANRSLAENRLKRKGYK